MPKVTAPKQVLELIDPIQVELTATVQLDRDTYKEKDIVTLEKHAGVALVRKGKAKSVNGEVNAERSANPFKVLTKKEAKAAAAPVAEATEETTAKVAQQEAPRVTKN